MKPIEWMNRITATDSGLSPTERLVGVVIALHADKDTLEAHPSQLTIARRSGFTRPRVNKAISCLEMEGWLLIRTTRGAGGRQGCHRYHLVCPESPTMTLDTIPESSTMTGGVIHDDTGHAHQSHPRRHNQSSIDQGPQSASALLDQLGIRRRKAG